MSENSSSNGPPPGMDTAAPFGFTFGNSHTQSAWSDFRRYSWPQLVEELTSHVPGEKEGSCIVPAKFTGSRRHKDDAERIDVVFLDSDSGAPLAEIEAALMRHGWEGVISSTHSHMSTQTRVRLSNWDRFFSRKPAARVEDFLIHEKGYLPSVARGAVAVETTSEYVFIQHQKCPKFRIALPLKRPWIASSYASQQAANAAWKERIEALAAALNLDHDQACTDTSRLFYLPRRPANGVVPETAVVSGSHCDIFSLPSADAVVEDLLSPIHPRKSTSERLEVADKQGELIDLPQWARDYGPRFLIADAIKARKPSEMTGHVSANKVHIDCPNQDAHSQAGRDGATYVMNGGTSNTKGFVVHCRHAHCTDKDRLFFVRRMLEEGWLTCDDLKDERFQAAVEAKTEEIKAPAEGLKIVYWDEIAPNLDAADFVEGLLISEAMSVVYGQSNSGKTFFLSDLALHVAGQMKWNDRAVENGAVLWIAMEGSHGIYNRIAAWKKHHQIPDGAQVNIAVIPIALNLLDPTADLPKLLDAIKAVKARLGMPVIWTIVDTLSRAIAGGNENSPEDMGALVTNGTRIQQETKSHLTWIHHSGKDEAKGARGHSLLRAASDTEIEISADGTQRVARVTKQREMECTGEMNFELKVIELGTNRRGKPVTSCVVVHAGHDENGVTAPPKHFMTGQAKRAYDVLADLIAEAGQTGTLPGHPNVPSVPDRFWRQSFYERAMPGASPESRKKAFQRVSSDLLNKSVVGFDRGQVWIVQAGTLPGHLRDISP